MTHILAYVKINAASVHFFGNKKKILHGLSRGFFHVEENAWVFSSRCVRRLCMSLTW